MNRILHPRVLRTNPNSLRTSPKPLVLSPFCPKLQSSSAIFPFSTTTSTSNSSDYGSGETPPGKNPSEHLEHPGPKAPDTSSSSASGGSASGGASGNGGKGGKPQPKVHSEEGNKGLGNEEDVERHNRELEGREKSFHAGEK